MLTCSMCNIDSDCVFNNPYKNNVDMKVPEKLYLSKNIYSTYMYQVPDPDDETSVEYTYTDAFVEKAVQWLKEHKEAVETENNGIMGWIPDYFIEDFKKYMEE